MFGGGATVSLNVSARKIVYNEINPFVVQLIKTLSQKHPVKVYEKISKLQKKYGLSKGNKEGYKLLRDDYNKTRDPILLYLLICYGFEHQIRFNSKHEFNNPCGNSGFNDEMYEKLISFYLRCHEINIEFVQGSYVDMADSIKKNDFVYLDPPYLGNNGAYQDGKRGFNGWDFEQEQELHMFVETLNKRKIKFMFSNYVEHTTGNENSLNSWSLKNGFNIFLSSHTIKRNRQNRREIIVTNYRKDD